MTNSISKSMFAAFLTFNIIFYLDILKLKWFILATQPCGTTLKSPNPLAFLVLNTDMHTHSHRPSFFFFSALPWSCLMAGSCDPCHSVGVCWWVGSVCPGWLVGAGFLRAAWPLGRPAWPPAELRTTAARSERQVERQRRVDLEGGVEGMGESKRRRRGKEEREGGREKRRKGRHE